MTKNISLTKINWTDQDSDVLEAVFDRTGNNTILISVKIEGFEVWNTNNNGIIVIDK